MRATIHNGRTSHLGAFTPKHNDRNFNISHAEHIDPERVKDNRYWNWTGKKITFEDAEIAFYRKCQKAEKRAADLQSILTAAERRQVEQIRQEQEREQKQFEDDEWEIE